MDEPAVFFFTIIGCLLIWVFTNLAYHTGYSSAQSDFLISPNAFARTTLRDNKGIDMPGKREVERIAE